MILRPVRGTTMPSVAFTVRLDPALYERLRKRSYDQRIAMNAILAAALRRYLDADGNS